jgi:hypothetical protein
MQLIPSTARAMGVTAPTDPRQNILGGTRYLTELYLERIKDNSLIEKSESLDLLLACYNAGPNKVFPDGPMGAVPDFKETRQYIKRVKKVFSSLGGGNIWSPPAGFMRDAIEPRLGNYGVMGNITTGETFTLFEEAFDQAGKATSGKIVLTLWDYFIIQEKPANAIIESTADGRKIVSIYFNEPWPAGTRKTAEVKVRLAPGAPSDLSYMVRVELENLNASGFKNLSYPYFGMEDATAYPAVIRHLCRN